MADTKYTTQNNLDDKNVILKKDTTKFVQQQYLGTATYTFNKKTNVLTKYGRRGDYLFSQSLDNDKNVLSFTYSDKKLDVVSRRFFTRYKAAFNVTYTNGDRKIIYVLGKDEEKTFNTSSKAVRKVTKRLAAIGIQLSFKNYNALVSDKELKHSAQLNIYKNRKISVEAANTLIDIVDEEGSISRDALFERAHQANIDIHTVNSEIANRILCADFSRPYSPKTLISNFSYVA